MAFTDLHELADMFASLAVPELCRMLGDDAGHGLAYMVVGPPTPEQLASRRERDRVARAVAVVTEDRRASKAAWQAAWRARNPEAYARELADNAERRRKARKKPYVRKARRSDRVPRRKKARKAVA